MATATHGVGRCRSAWELAMGLGTIYILHTKLNCTKLEIDHIGDAWWEWPFSASALHGFPKSYYYCLLSHLFRSSLAANAFNKCFIVAITRQILPLQHTYFQYQPLIVLSSTLCSARCASAYPGSMFISLPTHVGYIAYFNAKVVKVGHHFKEHVHAEWRVQWKWSTDTVEIVDPCGLSY